MNLRSREVNQIHTHALSHAVLLMRRKIYHENRFLEPPNYHHFLIFSFISVLSEFETAEPFLFDFHVF